MSDSYGPVSTSSPDAPMTTRSAPGTGTEAPFDSLYQAVKFASKQKPVPNCPTCTSKTEYYLFKKAKPHRLIEIAGQDRDLPPVPPHQDDLARLVGRDRQ